MWGNSQTRKNIQTPPTKTSHMLVSNTYIAYEYGPHSIRSAQTRLQFLLHCSETEYTYSSVPWETHHSTAKDNCTALHSLQKFLLQFTELKHHWCCSSVVAIGTWHLFQYTKTVAFTQLWGKRAVWAGQLHLEHFKCLLQGNSDGMMVSTFIVHDSINLTAQSVEGVGWGVVGSRKSHKN